MKIVDELPEGMGPLELNEETMAALKELGEAIRVVHDRLIREGYTLVDGKWIPPTDQHKT